MTTPAHPISTARMPSPSKLAHVVFRTSRYREMIGFYMNLLNAKVAFESDVLTFLTYDEEHHRIAILNAPGLSDAPAGICGLHHVAFTYDSLSDLVTTYKVLKVKGIMPVWCTNHGPTTSIYYRDPDGSQLELQVDNYDTVVESGKFFESPDFATNPIGVDFDPEDLVRRFESGESEQTIKLRPDSGPRVFDDSVGIH